MSLCTDSSDGDIIYEHLPSKDPSLEGILAMNAVHSRQRRTAPIPQGTKFGMKGSISFPVNSLTNLAASFQVTHQIFIPLISLYPEKGETERIDLNLDDYLEKKRILSKLLRRPEEDISDAQLQPFSKEGIDRIGGASFTNSFEPSNLTQFTRDIMEHNLIRPDLALDTNETSLERLAKFIDQESKEVHGPLKRDRLKSRQDRAIVYKDMESFLEKMGLPGRPCLLRTICEIGEQPFENSLSGEILNILMMASLAGRPEFFDEEEEYNDYVNAELYGRNEGQCHVEYKECSVSVFSLLYQLIKDLVL